MKFLILILFRAILFSKISIYIKIYEKETSRHSKTNKTLVALFSCSKQRVVLPITPIDSADEEIKKKDHFYMKRTSSTTTYSSTLHLANEIGYASPVVLKRKDDTTRICIDYRKLNEKIIKTRYLLLVIKDQIDRLQEAKMFSKDIRNSWCTRIWH